MFFRRQRTQGERVYRAAHELAQGGVNHAVAGQERLSAELRADDQGLEMHTIGTVDLDQRAL